jgi:uncharacterized protein (DUF1330 family)
VALKPFKHLYVNESKKIIGEIGKYLVINENKENIPNLWSAAKAVVIRKFISINPF